MNIVIFIGVSIGLAGSLMIAIAGYFAIVTRSTRESKTSGHLSPSEGRKTKAH